MVRTKVFVGNLSFTTKENELAKEFEVAGKVISANIITRGPRSLGYGFVEMDNEADAENAVKLLDKKEVDGRPINVEVAKPRQDEGQDANNAQGGAPSTRGGASRGRGARGGRGGRGGARGGAQDGQPREERPRQGQVGQQGQQPQGGERGAPRTRAARGAARGGAETRAPRAARPPRAEGEDNRTPSTTTLFVANLPFSLEDDAFAKVLKDGSLAYKTAHVVKKKTGKSKGFGFIEFETEADQQKALAALNNKDLEGRPLAVKVALTGGPRTEDGAPQTGSAPADAVTPANKPSAIKAAVATTPSDKKDVKQEQK